MNLGIEGRWALVCAASKGLGKGCARMLVADGVNVVITARGAEALEATARELRALNPSVTVVSVAGDITTPAGRATALAACPQVDILVNNAGGPPPGDFREWDRNIWLAALDANMLTPIELMKASVDAMAERGFGRIVNITSGAVKAPIDVLGLPTVHAAVSPALSRGCLAGGNSRDVTSRSIICCRDYSIPAACIPQRKALRARADKTIKWCLKPSAGGSLPAVSDLPTSLAHCALSCAAFMRGI
jgi:NAD(P)-dependent dehydrogenase (short-subunit alcohol dehydrogenase family)